MIDKYPMKVKMFDGSMGINWEEQIKSNMIHTYMTDPV